MSDRALLAALAPPAREAGAAILAKRAHGFERRAKSDGSPVTEADLAAEAILLEALAAIAPEIPVVSEENAESHRLEPPERYFLVDPLDGTKAFARGEDAFTVNIGLIERGSPILGVLYAPAFDRMFTGLVGHGAFEGDRPIAGREPAEPPHALISSSNASRRTRAWLSARAIEAARPLGSSLKFGLLAAGEADCYPRHGPTMEWDTAAGDAIVRAAGGATTDFEGALWRYGKPGYANGDFVAWARAPLSI